MAKDIKLECNTHDKCVPQEMIIQNVRLAAAYVPYQQLCTLLSPIEALKHGTVFPELYSPYECKEKKVSQFAKNRGGAYYE